jgi:hypothetical protein
VEVAEIERRFPGVFVWFGGQTWHWWGLVWCGRWRLVEALTAEELVVALGDAPRWPWPKGA